jgi:DNA-binding protein HU-beta
MSKRFLTDVIQQSSNVSGVASSRLAAEIIAAIKTEIIENGRFSLPDFGSFTVRETPKRSALNPRTGEKVAVKASATVKFKVSPSLKLAAFAAAKKAKRKATKAAKSE